MKKIVPGSFCIFFSSFTALALLLFFAGNYQGFTAKALFLLLDILKFSSFFCALAGAAYCALLARGTRRGSFRIRARDFVLAGLTLVFGLTVLFISQFIIVLTLPKL
ncbi:MAG: hypothetical protein FWG35_05170 [Spirochaetaceae bacterium]|nr:hypothetical protein [Spirochaetaceae bacterium]